MLVVVVCCVLLWCCFVKTESLHGEYKTSNVIVGCSLLLALSFVVHVCVVGGVVCNLLIVGRCCVLCVVVLLFCGTRNDS